MLPESLVRASRRSRSGQWLLVLKLCGNQRVDGVGRLRFDVRTGLKADEAEWKKRDVHTRHETATLELGKAVAWHYSPVGKPGELWFRFGIIVDIIGGKLKEDKAGKNSNPDVNVTLRAFDPPLRYPLNAVWKSTSASGGLLDGVASTAWRSTRRSGTNAP